MMESIMSITEIKKYLPQRFPFLFVDGVTEVIPGKEIVGFKNTTISEAYFQGHFPDNPIVPGVLLVESLAQLTMIMYGMTMKNEVSRPIGYLAGIEKIRFRYIVRPGECMMLYAKVKEELDNIARVSVKIKVENKLAVDGMIIMAQK